MSAVAALPEAAIDWSANTRTATAHRTAAYATDRMHPGVFVAAIGSYAAMLAGLWLLFGTDLSTGLSLIVCTAYFGMYFGVPVAMYRLARKTLLKEPPAGSMRRFLHGDLETVTGPVSGWSALSQVLVVPVSLTIGLIAMGIILKVVA
jgi:hypothetical protein